ncbi:Hypothetical protein NCS54_00937800 [Fusarium falciforme]|uniref:Hypothetical protein n=1 Tax=Fusarium falciforme TaxID=195108 RepID=UPI00230133C5|nr:Hypothetical protein NCS54_00937800 [Fusarium falciforme]WAO91893.1 Hypothetical protein NCS54_00937800 [Fusarium falciforme]
MRLSYSLLGAIALAGTHASPCIPGDSVTVSISTTTVTETVGTATSEAASSSGKSDAVSSSVSGSVSDVSVSFSRSSTESASTADDDSKSRTETATSATSGSDTSVTTESASTVTSTEGSTESSTGSTGSQDTASTATTATSDDSKESSTVSTNSHDTTLTSKSGDASTTSDASSQTTDVSKTSSDISSQTTSDASQTSSDASKTTSDASSQSTTGTSETTTGTSSQTTGTSSQTTSDASQTSSGASSQTTSDASKTTSDASQTTSGTSSQSTTGTSSESTTGTSSETTTGTSSQTTSEASKTTSATESTSTSAADSTTESATTSNSLSARSVSVSSSTETTSASLTTSSASVTSAASSTTSDSTSSSTSSSQLPVGTVDSTILIFAKDEYAASSAGWGFEGYGIPFEKVLVPQTGFELPTLNSSSSRGNYGGIVVVDSVSYEYSDGWRSAISTEQWEKIYEYQINFKVRLVRINEYPGPNFGTTASGAGCCAEGVDQLISLTDTSDFPTANLKTNAGLSTKGIWHYPATITDSNTKQIAKFGPGGDYAEDTVAGVINTFEGREQFVWFIGWAADWSQTTNFLQHAHIHWITRGVFLGKRKVHLSTQVDDVQLATGLYFPAGEEFKIRTDDLEGHVTWQTSLNARLPAGSDYWLEMAHNGNGDIIAAVEQPTGDDLCVPDYAVDYDYPPDTPLEWTKPPGTGEDKWSDEFVYGEYPWSETCAKLDDFASWFLDSDNLNAFAHLSHTFTHLELNNATYKDAAREIDFNRAWMSQMGIDQAQRYSTNGLVPPAITGLHNADVIKAWLDNQILYVVGDNTRTPLKNPNSKFWPLISTVEGNGYDGLVIVPRFATTIYYNCDTAECTTKEWIDTSGGSGDFTNLLDNARTENTRYLLGLQADPYMFHQANMRQVDMETITIGDQTGKMSLIMSWVETITQELYRLTDWPIVSLKHDDIAQYFLDRKTLDDCKPQLSYGFSDDGKTIESVTVTANGNTCDVPVPVTVPGGASASGGSSSSDTLGSEPTIEWVTLAGSPVTLTLSQPLTV